MERNELIDLIPAYALGALEAEERVAVEALLKVDAEARRELAVYQDITDVLAMSVPARPAPAYLGDDLRRRLAAERPVTPSIIQRQPVRRFNTWAAFLAAAAVVALVIAVTLLLNRPDPGAQLYGLIVAQAGFHQIVIEGANDVRGDLVVSPDGREAVIRLEQVPQLEDNHTLQLWLIDAEGAHSGGLFPVSDPQRIYYVVVPLEKAASQYAAFGMSVEPEGGSPLVTAPSTEPIFAVSAKI
ncbi:MAG: anti-sigma factor [Anaerolineae bacterium]